MQAEFIGLKELNSTFKEIQKSVGAKQFNVSRAKSYVHFTRKQARAGGLGLRENKPATVKIQGTVHPPLHFSGEMFSNLDVRSNVDKSADAGVFSNKKPKGAKISYEKIAKLQITGFRIPLQGEKGEKVRRFLAAHGIFPKKSRRFLIVTPRPFQDKSLKKYEGKGEDGKVVNKYLDRLWSRL